MLDLEKLDFVTELHGFVIWEDSEKGEVFVARKGGALCHKSFEGCDRMSLARTWIGEQ